VSHIDPAFGNEPNNGTRLPYFRAGPDDWWDEDPNSQHYNRHVISRDSPGENRKTCFYSGAAYAHAVSSDLQQLIRW